LNRNPPINTVAAPTHHRKMHISLAPDALKGRLDALVFGEENACYIEQWRRASFKTNVSVPTFATSVSGLFSQKQRIE
jgi:hypothetical protein